MLVSKEFSSKSCVPGLFRVLRTGFVPSLANRVCESGNPMIQDPQPDHSLSTLLEYYLLYIKNNILHCTYAANPSGNEWDIELVVTSRFSLYLVKSIHIANT
jgi:hypothetical protein